MAGILPPQVKTVEDLKRWYSYLEELSKKHPPIYADLGPTQYGELKGNRYEAGKQPERTRLVVLNPNIPEKDKAPVRAHEYSHLAIDLSPNLSYILDLLQPPTDYLELPAAVGRGLGGLYHQEGLMEEGLMSYLYPQRDVDKLIRKRANMYFTPQQLEFIPSLIRHLQYGPTWGSFWGAEEGKGKEIIDYMGRPVNISEILRR